jgi:ABC-2 type transport system ATP-binding protein
MSTILDVENIVRSFTRGVNVLDGVSFSVAEGEVVALLGRNGSGKTTLMHLIMGLIYPNDGHIRVFGMSPTVFPVEVKQRIGYVGETQILPPKATIPELIAIHRRLFPNWDRALETTLLERFRLAGNYKQLRHLSQGQAQQAALLLAVCHRPELLLLDEPAAGLDPAARREFLETSIQLLNREGTAILFSSHHMADVERLGGRALMLDNGTIRIDQPVDALREEHCVAVFEKRASLTEAAIAAIPTCLHVRSMQGDWHAVFYGSPLAVHQQLQQSLGVTDARITTVPLEEFFITMLGEQRSVAA